MTNILEDCFKLKSELDLLRPLEKSDEMRIMQKFRLDWNYHSNHLEGNSLSYGETKALILFGITAQGKPLKDHFEVTGHNEAINWVLDIVKEDRPLNESFIRELHQLILKESYTVDAITPDGQPTKKRVKVGEYKTTANHVKTSTGEVFRFASPEETPFLMNELILWYKEKSGEVDVDPIILASEFHYRYIRIHPFDDGNGRTARILMNFILIRFGYPPVIIKTEDKEHYFASLRQADAGTIKPFIEYVATNLKHSLALMIAGAKGESIEEKDDLEKEIALLEQSVLAVGDQINLTRNKDTLLKIFDHSVENIIQYFLSRSKLMDKFYFNSEFKIFVDSQPSSPIQYEVVSHAREQMKFNISLLVLSVFYRTFNKTGFKEFDFKSEITFDFDITKYQVSNKNDTSIEKLYGETLSESEMKRLVDGEIRRHKDIIASKVDDLRKGEA